MYKSQINSKQKEIVKLQTKIKVLNTNSTINNRNESNNSSNLSMLIKSKVNSTFCTINNKEDSEHNNKLKYDDIYNIYCQNQVIDNNYLNKNRTMSNIKPSRNNTNYFTLLNNKPSNKPNNINSQQNTIININSYLQKNFSSNSLRKNISNNYQRKTYINSSNKKKDIKQNNNNSSLSITNNTYNMNKNNIMINVNPKNINTNMNIEKLKVQKKLYEYQRLIDQKLNELIKNRHYCSNNKKSIFHIRRNSSPNYNNSQRKNTSSSIGLEYYLKKSKKKSITPNTNSHLNKNTVHKRQIVRTRMQSLEDKKNNHRNNSHSKSVKKNKNSINNINNMKQNLNKAGIYSKVGEDFIENSTGGKIESVNNNGKINLSLRKFIFTKCGNPSSNNINKKY